MPVSGNQLEAIAREGLRDFILEGELTPINGAPGAGQFRSEITNRAPIPNITADLKPRMGTERIVTKNVQVATDEVGPNGEEVLFPVGEGANLIRFVKQGRENQDSNGHYINYGVTNAFVEIVFYGTGLAIGVAFSDGARDIRATIDGGAETGNLWLGGGGGGSTILGSEFVDAYIPITIASGLTRGLHTVKIRNANGTNIGFQSFDIHNDNADIRVNPGTAVINGTERVVATETILDHNGSFTNELGTAGTKGGNAIIYLDADGVVKHDIQYTDVTQLNLASADHSNEELIDRHYFREFGSVRADDVGFLQKVSNSVSHKMI